MDVIGSLELNGSLVQSVENDARHRICIQSVIAAIVAGNTLTLFIFQIPPHIQPLHFLA